MTSRLVQMQARFQQKQIQEREEKLLRLYENQQQKAFEKVNRGSAGSNNSLGSTGGGKVRQMFDERRQKAGIDRSYPLEPLKGSKTHGHSRAGGVERGKFSTTRGVTKSTVHKSANQIRDGKSTVNKREITQHSAYNNNDHDETYVEHTYETNNLNQTFDKSHSTIIEMLSNHNLSDTLDNEEMPELGLDEQDEAYFTGKLSNLGGKLPSETIAVNVGEKNVSKLVKSDSRKTSKKETKPLVKRTVKPAALLQNPAPNNLVQSQASKTSSPLSSPTKSTSLTMQTVKNSPVKKGTPQPPQSAKVPCNTRPSAKQSAKTPVARDDLNECRYCNRRFAADRLETHEAICGKTNKKKRKTYDSTKHRVGGTELEPFVRRGKSSSNKSNKQPQKKDWRRTHEDFINAIRAAKQAQAHLAKGGKLSDLPPPPPSSNPDYIQCPYCGRKFNQAAAERHIPKCANYMFNKPKQGSPPKGKQTGKR